MLKHNDKNLRHQTDFSRVEKLTNIGQIAAGIAHELNTPLGSIILSADFIKEMENVTSVLEEVDKIKSRAEYCSKVVNELLSYVRKDDDVKKKNDLISIIVKVINLVKTETSKRNITLETSFALKNAFILCMENQIEQLFFNFFSNAFYAIRKNGRIFLSIERDDLLNQIVVTFSDNGCGITQDSIAQVFDPFYTTKPGSEGTGLGLALCKKIMVEHDGKIDVMSDIGKGTSFKLFFPAV
ncbi:MAG: sensor histidine kinase, partial [Candidatus Zixiibacteriota bacterium]